VPAFLIAQVTGAMLATAMLRWMTAPSEATRDAALLEHPAKVTRSRP
jgi:glycerol uptake facilitator-like aquaporin